MNLYDFFSLTLQGMADKPALEFGGERYTFGDLDQRSARLAAHLDSNGFRVGDRLAVQMANSIGLIDIFLASVRLGLIFTPINVLYRDREVAHIVEDAGPRAFYPGAETPDAATATGEPPSIDLEGDAPAALLYTSGTTGRSKGAVLTHNNFITNATALNTCWQMSPSDRMLLALPLFHVHGLANGLHTWLSTGFRIRLLDRFRKETILDEFLDFEPTVFFGVPTMYERLVDAPPDTARRIGERMRLFVSGSAPLAAHTLERFRHLYGHTILERYGMTETLMNISNPYAGERRPGTVGKPLPGVSVRLDEGEILIRGPNVFSGYWRNEAATGEAFTSDGWFRSGDLATRSPDGYYTLTGRKSELIISGGFNIYPREVEEFLREQPGVAEAAVVGEPDQVRGQRPIAFIVAAPGSEVDPDSLREICRRSLASFKTPQRIEIVDSLPRNALGKLQRHKL